MIGRGLVVVFVISVLSMNAKQASPQSSSEPIQARSQFEFTLPVSLEIAAPLFGPEGERCWAGAHWNPQFLYPRPGKDVEGAVFTVEHGEVRSVWVNTLFDLANGRMQYVSLIPDAVVSIINVRLTRLGSNKTEVQVTYTRTALAVAENEHVSALARSDRENGPQWQGAIESCLAKEKRER